MLEYAERALRLELVLKSNQLREWQLHHVAHWNAETGKMLLLERIKGLEMSNNIRLTDEVIATLPTRVKMSYFTWLAGEDLKQILPRPTFYRYRAELKKYDIDIGIIRDMKEDKNNVIPLVRVLEAQPVGVPDWAIEKGLVACM